HLPVYPRRRRNSPVALGRCHGTSVACVSPEWSNSSCLFPSTSPPRPRPKTSPPRRGSCPTSFMLRPVPDDLADRGSRRSITNTSPSWRTWRPSGFPPETIDLVVCTHLH